MEGILCRATTITEKLGHLYYNGKLRSWTVQHGEGKAQGVLIHLQTLQRLGNERWSRGNCVLLSSAHWQNKGLWSLKNIKFHLNRRKHAFTVGVAEHWNRLSRGIDSWPQRFQYQGDIKNLTGHGAGKNTFGVPAWAGCGTIWSPEVSTSPCHPVTLCYMNL